MVTMAGKSVALRPRSGRSLKAGELGLIDVTAVAVASVSPAYSLAATVSFIFVALGYASPAGILVSFIPVLFVAFAYYFFNRKDPNCGAAYAWLTNTVSPFLGWFTGWVQLVASILFVILSPILAGSNTLAFFSNIGWVSSTTASSPSWAAFIGLIWLVIVTLISAYGIRLTVDFQWVLVGIEYVALFVFSVFAIFWVSGHHVAGTSSFHLSWLDPFSLKTVGELSAGTVLGVFFFWGWDTSSNLNEEAKDPSETPGRAGIIAMVFLLAIFMLNVVAIEMRIPAHEITSQGTNVLYYFAHTVSPGLSVVMLFAILSSTVATTQTTILPVARIAYSMARDKVFPRPFGVVSDKFKTPIIGTLMVGGLSCVGIALTTISSSVNSIFLSMITDIGVLVTFYYGATGLGSAWAYRKALLTSPSILFLAGILPLAGGLFLFWVGYQVMATRGGPALAPILIIFFSGVPMVAIAKALDKSGYFDSQAVAYEN